MLGFYSTCDCAYLPEISWVMNICMIKQKHQHTHINVGNNLRGNFEDKLNSIISVHYNLPAQKDRRAQNKTPTNLQNDDHHHHLVPNNLD